MLHNISQDKEFLKNLIFKIKVKVYLKDRIMGNLGP